ncbi:MAG: hypothetical protein EPN36_13915 [Rhodanobacteraceae bacterium]|nr:MAG: hypothetical protein EPN36_13915 [Rhodanobacteraceae bacterium]
MSRHIPVLGSPVMRAARPAQFACAGLALPLVCATFLLGMRVLHAPDTVFGAVATAAAATVFVLTVMWADGEGFVRELGLGDLAELKAAIEGEPDLVVAVGKYLATGHTLLTTEAAALRHEVTCRRDERARAAVAAGAKDGDGQALEFFTGAYANSRNDTGCGGDGAGAKSVGA